MHNSAAYRASLHLSKTFITFNMNLNVRWYWFSFKCLDCESQHTITSIDKKSFLYILCPGTWHKMQTETSRLIIGFIVHLPQVLGITERELVEGNDTVVNPLDKSRKKIIVNNGNNTVTDFLSKQKLTKYSSLLKKFKSVSIFSVLKYLTLKYFHIKEHQCLLHSLNM